MAEKKSYKLYISDFEDKKELYKNTWLVILHATRTPPHIGILIDGNYNSLTIKGHELNVNIDILLRTIQQKKIETLFIQLKKHPVFSSSYQKEICQLYIQKFPYVKDNVASCLNPIKLFLDEFYAIKEKNQELLFELIERIKENDFISHTWSLNIDKHLENNHFSLPIYSNKLLQKIIKSEHNNHYLQ